MLGTALYYPNIEIEDSAWLRSAILFWDEVQTIVPTSVRSPYRSKETRACYEEGYLRPLPCDMHQDLLDDLGRRVFKLLEEPEWQWRLANSDGPAGNSLIHADKLGSEMKWRLQELVGIHPDKMPPSLRDALLRAGGLTWLSTRKIGSRLEHAIREAAHTGRHDHIFLELSRAARSRPYHDEGDWLLVDGRFAQIYMSALAALLARELQVSPLTNEEPSSGVNLRCLIDDVATSGETSARGALVSVVMEGLRVDPSVPIQKLLSFRRGRTDQLIELSAQFDELKGKIEKAATAQEMENGAKRLFENKIRPGLEKLKTELDNQCIQSVWEGFQRGITVSAAGTGALAYITGYTGPMLLGAAAFLTVADIGVKSYFARQKARASSPYTYLMDVERRFSLPNF